MRRLWYKEEDELMRKYYPHEFTERVAVRLNRSVKSVYSRATILGLKKSPKFQKELNEYYGEVLKREGKTTRFSKGHVTFNIGKKQTEYMSPEMIECTKATQFKKGHLPHNHKQVGHQRVTVDGYIEVKVGEPKRFVLLHRWLWKIWNGPIPKGYVITFKDGNPQNCNIDNLECISQKEHMANNTIQRYPDELKEVIRLQSKLNKIIKTKN